MQSQRLLCKRWLCGKLLRFILDTYCLCTILGSKKEACEPRGSNFFTIQDGRPHVISDVEILITLVKMVLPNVFHIPLLTAAELWFLKLLQDYRTSLNTSSAPFSDQIQALLLETLMFLKAFPSLTFFFFSKFSIPWVPLVPYPDNFPYSSSDIQWSARSFSSFPFLFCLSLFFSPGFKEKKKLNSVFTVWHELTSQLKFSHPQWRQQNLNAYEDISRFRRINYSDKGDFRRTHWNPPYKLCTST